MLIAGADAHFDGLGIGTGIVGQLDSEEDKFRSLLFRHIVVFRLRLSDEAYSTCGGS